MSSILQAISQQLSGDTLRQMSRALSTDEASTGKAVSAALPLLLSALSRNASEPQGAQALHSALSKDHDGSLLDNLGGLLGAVGGMGGLSGAAGAAGGLGRAANGEGILKHLLGDRRGTAEAALSKTSGLDSRTISTLLTMLAPIVLAQLGKARSQRGLDASGLAGLLGGESQSMRQTAPDAMGALTKLLDADGDGNVMDDVGGMLGKFFNR